MRSYVLISATMLLALGGCNSGQENDQNVSNDSAALVPQDCTKTEGVSKGPFCGFTAPQNLRLPIQQPTLTVTGDYRFGSRTGTLSLRKAVPQGINPKILLLDLVVDTSTGSGGHWVTVTGAFDAEDGQYDSVTVHDDKGQEVNVPVEPSSKAAMAAGDKVSFRGCPMKSGIGAGCLTVKSDDGATYELYSSGPLPDPAQRLIVEGTGIGGGVSTCVVGRPLNEVEWRYTKAKCPNSDGKE